MAYVVALTRDKLRVASVKHHLAGMRIAQIKAGMAAPDWGAMARLTQLRKGLAEEGAREMAPREGNASSMEARRKEGSNAVGSDMHVLFWLHESRRGPTPRRSRVRWEGLPVSGGHPAGKCTQSQVD